MLRHAKLKLLLLGVAALVNGPAVAAGKLQATLETVQPKMVKIYGAGGFRSLETYQSGFLISSEGHIATAFSYVLDTPGLSVTLDDGRRFPARLLGADPHTEIAVLKIDAADLPFFDLDTIVSAEPGDPVLALSNLFGVAYGNEACSVQRGVVAAVTTLDARRGAYKTPYRGPIYVIDAMTNNPGAAGGALISTRGELLGMLGKELRSSIDLTWLNYAVPSDVLRETALALQQGRQIAPRPEDLRALQLAWSPELAGFVLIPNILRRTPPYVDQIRPGTPASRSHLRPDDLIIMVNDRLIPSQMELYEALGYADQLDPLRVTLLRGTALIELEMTLTEKASPP